MSAVAQLRHLALLLLLGVGILPVLAKTLGTNRAHDKYRSAGLYGSRIHLRHRREATLFPETQVDAPQSESGQPGARNLMLASFFGMVDKANRRKMWSANSQTKNEGKDAGFVSDIRLGKHFEQPRGNNNEIPLIPYAPNMISDLDDVNEHVNNGPSVAEQYGGSSVAKRRSYDCDLTRVTINTILEYLRTGKVCGFRVANVRFGVGR